MNKKTRSFKVGGNTVTVFVLLQNILLLMSMKFSLMSVVLSVLTFFFVVVAIRSRGDGRAASCLRFAVWYLGISPSLFFLFAFEIMFVSFFSFKGIMAAILYGSSFFFLSSGGLASVLILCVILPIMTIFFLSFNLPALILPAIMVTLAISFSARRIRIIIPPIARFLLFVAYGTVFYTGIWYGSSAMLYSTNLNGDPAVRHLTEFEATVKKLPSYKTFYSVIDDCAGEKLYLTNPSSHKNEGRGIIEWSRGAKRTVVHDFNGSAETIAFDCKEKNIFIAEIVTGNVYAYHGSDLNAKQESFHTEIKKPCRIYHYPASELLYLHSDTMIGKFWYVIDTKGKNISSIKMKIQEVVPLPDDSFIAASEGKVYHFYVNRKMKKIEELDMIEIPEKLYSTSGFGVYIEHIQYDEPNDTVFVSDFDSGNLYKIGMSDRKSIKLANLGRGLRHIAFAPDYGVIAAGNYITGMFFLIDAKSGRTIYKKPLGSRLRGITLSSNGDKIFAVSRGGVFDISLDVIIPRIVR